MRGGGGLHQSEGGSGPLPGQCGGLHQSEEGSAPLPGQCPAALLPRGRIYERHVEAA